MWRVHVIDAHSMLMIVETFRLSRRFQLVALSRFRHGDVGRPGRAVSRSPRGVASVGSLCAWVSVCSQVDVEQYVRGLQQSARLGGSRRTFDEKAVNDLCCAPWQVRAAVVYFAQHNGLVGGASCCRICVCSAGLCSDIPSNRLSNTVGNMRRCLAARPSLDPEGVVPSPHVCIGCVFSLRLSLLETSTGRRISRLRRRTKSSPWIASSIGWCVRRSWVRVLSHRPGARGHGL